MKQLSRPLLLFMFVVCSFGNARAGELSNDTIHGVMMIPGSVSGLEAEGGVYWAGTLQRSSGFTSLNFQYSRYFQPSQAKYAKIICSGKVLSVGLPANISLSCSDGLAGSAHLSQYPCDKNGDFTGGGVITLGEAITGDFTFPLPTSTPQSCPPILVR